MRTAEELLHDYVHFPEQFPVLAQQTHRVYRNGKMVNERININENLMHYLKETALLISVIDGRLHEGIAYDHIIYLDKSARPVSWLVNMFWSDFALKDTKGIPAKRPKHSYINIDRAPWFRNVGINVDNDGRQKENGELATYRDFLDKVHNISPRHLAEIRALYVEGGIEEENVDRIMSCPTILDSKRVLIVDEVSRTGSTLEIAKYLFKLAIPDVGEINGTYFWHPDEPLLKIGEEKMLTSLPVWYDPDTLEGRGIGNPDPYYYRERYEKCLMRNDGIPQRVIRKFRTHAFASSVFSAPLLDENGEALDLAIEKKTRNLAKDLKRLYAEFHEGRVFFIPPTEWIDFDCFESVLEDQGVLILPFDSSEEEKERIKRSPLFFLNFTSELMKL